MPSYLILAQSEITASALNSWIELLGIAGLPVNDPRRIVWDRNVEGVDAYEPLTRRIELAAKGEYSSVPLNDVVVLVDSVNQSGMSVVGEGGQWSSLIAMLILSFPEIRWVFGICKEKNSISIADINWVDIEPYHSLSTLLTQSRRDPLFDPTGLRDWIRQITNKGLLAAKDDLELPIRKKLAAAIDEEKAYAYIHGYTAYRFGYRVDAVTTWKLMSERFSGEKSTRIENEPHGYSLLLEDMSLNFPDRPPYKHLLKLDKSVTDPGRADCFPMLDSTDNVVENSEHRILITTGQTRPGDNTLAENRAYLRAKATGKGKVVFKPACGMFDLWDKIGLFKKFPNSRRKGNEENFHWPPEPASAQSGESNGHGAPGKLMLVAETLIQRAEMLLDNVRIVGEAVQGSVLTTDALELTGGRTPTTAFEALSLKHQFEVTAECQFSGVEFHIQIKPRLQEIAVEVSAISRWFHSTQRANAMLNAEMHIQNQLVRVLRSFNQYDEEQICMNRVRHLHNGLWVRQNPFPRLAMAPLLWYLELLLSSFAVFVIVIFVWIIGLSILYWLTATHETWGYGLSDAITSFFSIGGPIHPDSGKDAGISVWNALVINIAIVSGFVHLGVFITHLYSIISKR